MLNTKAVNANRSSLQLLLRPLSVFAGILSHAAFSFLAERNTVHAIQNISVLCLPYAPKTAMAKYPQRKLGDDMVSAQGLGCMGMSFG